MRILLTNDDGINAPGLKVLEAIAARLTAPENIWVVAPAFEQSGVGHCISYTRPLMMAEHGPRRVAVEGSPADCVIAGLGAVMDVRPDLVLSGVNRGNNSAENTLYSGTLGAALEGALQRVPSIGLSQYYGPANARAENPFDAAAVHGADIVTRILEAGFDEGADYGLFYNVNFPPVMATDVKGTQVVRQGVRDGVFFGAVSDTSPNGRGFLWIKGGNQHVTVPDDTDAGANMAGYISVTPMRADLTAYNVMDKVSEAFGGDV
ncbi:MAG: 5'/3'-nucleotidase SurE [Pseudomonadota bacterium]